MKGYTVHGPIATYALVLRRRPWLVIVVALLTVGASIAWLQLRSPAYRATAEVLVTPLPQDDPDLVGIQPLPDAPETTRTVQTAAGLLRSTEAARETARRIGRRYTTARVLNAIQIEPRGESNLVAIVGSADSPALAAQLANVFTSAVLGIRGRAFQSSLEKRIVSLHRQAITLSRPAPRPSEAPALKAAVLEISQRANRLRELRGTGDPSMRQSDLARLPTAISGAPHWLIITLAAVFGLALGSGAALLRSAADHRITEEGELLTIYPLAVLVRIADGEDRYVAQNREAFRTLAVRLDGYARRRATASVPAEQGGSEVPPLATSPPRRRHDRGFSALADKPPVSAPAVNGPDTDASQQELARVLLVSSASSGDGKTTCATALARALAAAGSLVILIDLNLRHPGCAPALGLTVSPDRTLLHTEFYSEALIEVPEIPLMRLIVGGVARDDAELVSLSRRAAGIVQAARVDAEFVIVDTAPLGRVGDALHVAPSADEILLVARLGNTERDALVRVRDLLEQSSLGAWGWLLIQPTTAAQARGYAHALNSDRGR